MVGLGAMGLRMARVLLAAGHEVVGHDVSAEAVDELVKAGGRPADSAALACRDAEALVLMVVKAPQAEAVLFGNGGARETLRPGRPVLACLTMSPGEAEALGERALEWGWLYLDAPVSGGVAGAEAGTLTFMLGCPEAAYESAKPLLEALGRKIVRLGERPGMGSLMKTVHQLAAGANLAVAAETLALAASLGLDPRQVQDILMNSAGYSWMVEHRGPAMLEPPERPGSTMEIFVKDLGNVLQAASGARFPLFMGSAAHQVFLGAVRAGLGDQDDSQVVRFYEALGGTPVARPKDGSKGTSGG